MKRLIAKTNSGVGIITPGKKSYKYVSGNHYIYIYGMSICLINYIYTRQEYLVANKIPIICLA